MSNAENNIPFDLSLPYIENNLDDDDIVEAGIILGPSVLGKYYSKYNGVIHLPSQIQFVSIMGFYAVLYHVFIISVKTDFAMVLKLRRRYWVMGITSLFSQIIIVSIFVNILKPIPFRSAFTTHVIAFQSSTTWFISLVPLLEQHNLLSTEVGQLSISLSLTNDILVWCNAIVLILVRSVGDTNSVTKCILPLFLLIGFIILVLRPVILAVVNKLPRGQPVHDIYIVVTFLGAGVIGLLFDLIIGSPLIGFMIIGLVVPHGPPLGLAIVERGDIFIQNCLLPLFFLAAGSSVQLEAKNIGGQLIFLIIIVGGHIAKTMTTMFCAMWYNIIPRQGFALGLLMNTSGVIHILVYWSQLMRQRIDNYVSSELVMCSILVTGVATPLAIYVHKLSKKDHQSIRGFQLSVQSALMGSRMHMLMCVDNEDDTPGFITFLKASNPTDARPIHVYLVHLIELVGQAAPMLIPHKKHNRMCNYNGCIHIFNTVSTYCDNASQGGISIQLLTMIAPFTSIHESICKLADDKMIPLIIVPFYYKTHGNFGNSASSQLNLKLQKQTPCTLGIFVNKDKGQQQNQNPTAPFSYNVLVLFFGGEDDREALTYASRMSTHPGVRITLVKLLVQEYDAMKNEDEVLQDDSVLDNFKNNENMIPSSLKYMEFHIPEWLQTLGVVQTLDKDYDLVILGRRHGHQKPIFEDDLYVLSENPELGDIGELLVSGELQWENSSFLVMQHCLGYEKETYGNVILLDDS